MDVWPSCGSRSLAPVAKRSKCPVNGPVTSCQFLRHECSHHSARAWSCARINSLPLRPTKQSISRPYSVTIESKQFRSQCINNKHDRFYARYANFEGYSRYCKQYILSTLGSWELWEMGRKRDARDASVGRCSGCGNFPTALTRAGRVHIARRHQRPSCTANCIKLSHNMCLLDTILFWRPFFPSGD